MTTPDAQLLTRMNTLKQLNHEKYLTTSQEEALDEILDSREDGEPFINLHGSKMVGKTFLCWALREHGWTYRHAPPRKVTDPDVTAVIYDHGSPQRRATRQLRNSVDLSGLSNAVYVTRTPAEELYPRVELSADEDEYRTIANNWETVGIDTAPLSRVDAAITNTINKN